jgi:protein transport protein SEC13
VKPLLVNGQVSLSMQIMNQAVRSLPMIYMHTRHHCTSYLAYHCHHSLFLYDQNQSVNSVSFAPHEYGLIIACGSADGKVSVLTHQADGSWATSKFSPSTAGINAVTWAPYGHLGSIVDGASILRLATASCDNNVQVWKNKLGSPEGWVEESTLSFHGEWVRDVSWAPNTGMPCNTLASCSEDKQVIIWTQSKPGDAWTPQRLCAGFDAPVWRVRYGNCSYSLPLNEAFSSLLLFIPQLEFLWKCAGSLQW